MGQVDKGGAPYILHPLRIMFHVKHIDEKIVAVLHDVMEDAPSFIPYLRGQGFSKQIMEALELLNHDQKTSYDDYIAAIKENDFARRVKIADLCDNMNMTRIEKQTVRDLERLEKYKKAHSFLTK